MEYFREKLNFSRLFQKRTVLCALDPAELIVSKMM
jgi:hypothetical protein